MATAPEPRRLRNRLSFLVCELVLLAWVARDLWMHAATIPARVRLPYQLNYEEGNFLNALARIAHGLGPYPDPHAFPNVLNPYGPLAYYLLAIPVQLFGVSFTGPRLIVVASVVAICVLLALILARLGASWLTAALFGLLYATLNLVQEWNGLLRVDFPALALSLTGLYLFSRGCATEDTEDTEKKLSQCHPERSEGPLPVPNRQSSILDSPGPICNLQSAICNSSAPSVAKPRVLLASALFSAALLMKFTLLAAPAACLLYLLQRRQTRAAAKFAGLMIAFCGLGLALGEALTHGRMGVHLFLTHPDPFSVVQFGARMGHIAAVHLPLLALAAVYLIAEWRRRRLSLPLLWLLMATAAALTAGKLGSSWNHFLEWPAALCLCAGLGWQRLSRLRPRTLALAATVAMTAWLGVFLLQPGGEANYLYTRNECPQAYYLVRNNAGGDVLSENVGALVLAGKTVWVSNPFVLAQLVAHGGWSDAPLVQMVRARGFSLVLFDQDYAGSPYFLAHGAERWSPQLLQAVRENYAVARHFQCTDAAVVYAPKPTPPPGTVESK